MFSITRVVKDIEAGNFVSNSLKKLAIDQIRILTENAINPTKAQGELARLHIKKLSDSYDTNKDGPLDLWKTSHKLNPANIENYLNGN